MTAVGAAGEAHGVVGNSLDTGLILVGFHGTGKFPRLGSPDGLPMNQEFFLMLTDMVMNPQLETVMGRQGMKVASKKVTWV